MGQGHGSFKRDIPDEVRVGLIRLPTPDEVKEGVNNYLSSILDTKLRLAWDSPPEKRSIYKVPIWIKSLNNEAFVPQVVSLGPYHFSKKVSPMDHHKERAFTHLLERSGKHHAVLTDSILQMVDDLKNSYDDLDLFWNDEARAFLMMMILDGCFMLEILRFDNNIVNDYASTDPIFSDHGRKYMIPLIKRDMLMIENQLPMLLLDKLNEIGSKDEAPSATQLIAKSFIPHPVGSLDEKYFHVLDLYHSHYTQGTSFKTSIHGDDRRVQSFATDITTPSAVELDEAGVRFEKSQTFSYRDISFKEGVLRLPAITVDSSTESKFLNLMAFERFHYKAGQHVTAYIFFMKTMLDTQKDVALLVRRGIIENAYGTNKEVADLFNSLSRYITIHPPTDDDNELKFVRIELDDYRKKPWNQWRATLHRVYFGNPWLTLSVIGAFSLFILTLIQTIYSVLSYYKPDSPQPPNM